MKPFVTPVFISCRCFRPESVNISPQYELKLLSA
uniref:Uncharacterized protein n=1 Tax=Anguilla anguilla TaxID=7936 RepID=A0A0E9Q3Y7_ANGAN